MPSGGVTAASEETQLPLLPSLVKPSLPSKPRIFLVSSFLKGLRFVTRQGFASRQEEAQEGNGKDICHLLSPASIVPGAAELQHAACPFAGLLLSTQSSPGISEALVELRQNTPWEIPEREADRAEDG